MDQFETVTVRGNGVGALKEYFKALGDSSLGKIPPLVADWQDEARYDSPHGILTVWESGAWEATYSLASVVADIKRVRGLTVIKDA